MLRLFITLNLLLLNLLACDVGYDSCIKKLIDSNSITKQDIQVSISKNQRLVFSKEKPSFKILKANPFLSLYLVEDKNNFKHPFKLNINSSLKTALVNEVISKEGSIKKNQLGLNQFATYSKELFTPSVLTNSCCSLEGFVTSKGIIQREYIEKFLKSKNNNYSDLGIRVENENSYVVVKNIDPFMKNNLFKKDDCIISMDGKKAKNSSSFMMDLLFLKVGTTHKFKIIRDKKTIELSAVTEKRYGGGFISDTFLEQKGIYFDEDLKIIKLPNKDKNYGLKLGDKLIQVNNVDIDNQEQARENMANFKDYSFLLFHRNGFQFFIHIK